MNTTRQRVSAILAWAMALLIAATCGAMLWTAPPSHAQAIQPDKVKHFAVSAALGSVARMQIDNPRTAWLVAMAPGVAKELWDARKGGSGFSVPDLAADALGAWVGVKLGGWAVKLRRDSITFTKEL